MWCSFFSVAASIFGLGRIGQAAMGGSVTRGSSLNWATLNARAVKRGEKQVEAYRQQLEMQTKEKWTCSVETYCRK